MRWPSVMRVRRISYALSLVVGVACLGGCSGDAMLSRFLRPDDDAFARAYFDSVRTGRVDYALAVLEPPFASLPGERDSLARLGAYLPPGPLDSVHVIGVSRFTFAEHHRSNLTYEYHSAQGWGVVAISVDGGPAGHAIFGIHAYHLAQPLERVNAFTFRSKGVGHYLMLALVLTCLASGVSVAVLALRTKMKRRWAWALLALVGAGAVMFNWTTGQVAFTFLKVLFFNAAAARAGEAAPWVFEAAFPIGALMTWRRIQQARNPAPSPDASASPAPSAVDTATISTDGGTR